MSYSAFVQGAIFIAYSFGIYNNDKKKKKLQLVARIANAEIVLVRFSLVLFTCLQDCLKVISDYNQICKTNFQFKNKKTIKKKLQLIGGNANAEIVLVNFSLVLFTCLPDCLKVIGDYNQNCITNFQFKNKALQINLQSFIMRCEIC